MGTRRHAPPGSADRAPARDGGEFTLPSTVAGLERRKRTLLFYLRWLPQHEHRLRAAASTELRAAQRAADAPAGKGRRR